MQDRQQQIGHRQQRGKQRRWAGRSVDDQTDLRICQHVADRTVQQRWAMRDGRGEGHRAWHVGVAVGEKCDAGGGRTQRSTPVRLLEQLVGEAAPVAQRHSEMQPKGVLRIEIERDHLPAGSRQAAGDVGSERGLPDTTFG